jgi:hypothetical protein
LKSGDGIRSSQSICCDEQLGRSRILAFFVGDSAGCRLLMAAVMGVWLTVTLSSASDCLLSSSLSEELACAAKLRLRIDRGSQLESRSPSLSSSLESKTGSPLNRGAVRGSEGAEATARCFCGLGDAKIRSCRGEYLLKSGTEKFASVVVTEFAEDSGV